MKRKAQIIDPRVVGYLRVSSWEQARPEKPSLTQQEEKIRALCAVHDWQVVEVYCDTTSGKKWERPALQRLLTDAQTGAFGRVLFLKIDRLARNTRDLLETSERLEDAGVGLVSVKESFDTSTPIGKFYFTLLGALAELESGTISERTSSGRLGRVQAGKYQSPITPYGYVYDRESGHLTPDPETAVVVQRIFRWATEENLGLKAIVNRLEAEKIITPGRKGKWGWHHTSVRKLLTAPRYIGKGMYGDEPMPCPPIIDPETFYAAQEALQRRRREKTRAPRSRALLRDLIHCRTCGGRYNTLTASLAAGPTTIYLCRQRRVYGPKAGHQDVQWRWRANELEGIVKRHVLRVLVDRDYLVHDAQVYVKEHEQSAGEQHIREAGLRAQLTKLEERERQVLEWAEDIGIYRNREQAVQRLENIRTQQDEVKAALKTATRKAEVELNKAEKVRLLAGLVMRHAYVDHIGWDRQVKGPDWIEQALVDIDGRTHVQMDLAEGNEKPRLVTVAVNDWWRDVIETLVERIWIEPSGAMTIQGILPCASTGQVLKAQPSR